ncbi:MAG: hypothetical protein U9N44_00950 [Chloroflexota bacterium]|nr:hypothetical protein [Chloroflexota bacterium]
MDTQILIYIGAGIGGILVGAFATHFIEKMIFNREMEKLKIAWRHEMRMRSVEPVREYLDKLKFLVGATRQQAIQKRTGVGDNAELNDMVVARFREAQSVEPGTEFSVGDNKLSDLLRELRLDNKDHVRFISPNLWFSAKFRERLQKAHKRLEELATEI